SPPTPRPPAPPRRRRGAFLAIHERRDAAGGHAIEGAAARVRALGGETRIAYSRGRHARMLLLSNGMPRVESGLDVLVHRRAKLLRRQRVALLAHQASIDADYTHATTLLGDLPSAKLVAPLPPHHPPWGAPQHHPRPSRPPPRGPAWGAPPGIARASPAPAIGRRACRCGASTARGSSRRPTCSA